VVTLVALLTLVLTAFAGGAGAQTPRRAGAPETFDFQGELRGSADADARAGAVQPTAAQLGAVAAMRADARWNRSARRRR
jgi:hypothetical protein